MMVVADRPLVAPYRIGVEMGGTFTGPSRADASGAGGSDETPSTPLPAAFAGPDRPRRPAGRPPVPAPFDAAADLSAAQAGVPSS